ncbi:hypothetical protein D9M70_543370 [compost metagenome]
MTEQLAAVVPSRVSLRSSGEKISLMETLAAGLLVSASGFLCSCHSRDSGMNSQT